MINHLCNHGKYVQTSDKAAVMEERTCPWDPSEHVNSYINHIKKAVKQLDGANIISVSNACNDQALIDFTQCLNFDKIIDEWEKKDPHDQTWKKLQKFLPIKYAKLKHKVGEHSAKGTSFGIVTMINEAVPMLKNYATATSKIFVTVTINTDKNSKLPRRNSKF